MTLILVVILVALIFEYTNGFHDTANSIATVVTSDVLVCALLGAIVWNLPTWWLGLPSSSSHALAGGLCGACLAAANNHSSVIIWFLPGTTHWWKGKGLLWKVVLPMVTSPLCGLVGGFLVMGLLYYWLRRWRPYTVNRVFGRLQLFSAAHLGFSHGTNDAQKTLGHKMVKLHPVHGFAAETTSASVLLAASHLGMPLSTTHAITTSIMGVGCAKGFNALQFSVVEQILWAWVLTIPASGGVGYLLVKLVERWGWIH